MTKSSNINLIASTFYVLGCLIYIPAGFLLKFQETYGESILLFIIGSTFLTVGALIDFYQKIKLKPKESQKLVSEIENGLTFDKKIDQWKTAMIISVAYIMGGAFFLLGSIFFLSSLVKELGTFGIWTFRCGSCFYLIGSIISLKGLLCLKKKNILIKMWIACLTFYILGSCVYLIGGILSQLGKEGSTELWILGGFFFSLGSICGFIATFKSN